MSRNTRAWQVVKRLAPDIAVVHHINGRIRLKLTGSRMLRDSYPRLSMDEICLALETLNGIRSVRVNLLARSCTVEYDEKVIPQQAWIDLLNCTASPAADALICALHSKYDEFAGN